MNETIDEAADKAHDAVDTTKAAADAFANRTTDTAGAAKTEAITDFDTLRKAATEQFNEVMEQLNILGHQAMAKFTELADNVDVDALKTQAGEHLDATKQVLSGKFEELKNMAGDQLDDMPARFDELKEQATGKFHEFKQLVSEQVAVAGQKLDDLKAAAEAKRNGTTTGSAEKGTGGSQS